MNTSKMKLGTKLDLELINGKGDKIGQTYVSQLIEVIDNSTISIAAPIHESRLMLIPVGSKVRVVFLHDRYGLLAFIGSIISKEKKDALIVLNTLVESEFEKIQRRNFFRLDCILDAFYYFPDDPNNTTQDQLNPEYKSAITKNLSGSGASIIIEQEIPKGSSIDLRIQLNNENTIAVLCKVVRCTEIAASKGKKYDLGLHFKGITQRDQDILIKYIYDQQRLLLRKSVVSKE
ncbi:MAG: PilZ domain-containing protein [Clostridia bacterium]|nr:PilZ domain-containing protein [Clostridia bacterium]